MPKFMTYQRPTPVEKQNWSHAPDRKANVPRKAPEAQTSTSPSITVPVLDQLIHKS